MLRPRACPGAYILADATGGAPEVILMAAAARLALCLGTYAQLPKEDPGGTGGQDAVLRIV